MPHTTCGTLFNVDDTLLEFCAQHDWYLANGYVKSRIGYLHHVVNGVPPNGLVTDHIDRNRLNNRKNNLRHLTVQQNALNIKTLLGKERNVYVMRESTKNPWCFQLRRKHQKVYIGKLPDKQTAINARDAWLAINDPITAQTIYSL